MLCSSYGTKFKTHFLSISSTRVLQPLTGACVICSFCFRCWCTRSYSQRTFGSSLNVADELFFTNYSVKCLNSCLHSCWRTGEQNVECCFWFSAIYEQLSLGNLVSVLLHEIVVIVWWVFVSYELQLYLCDTLGECLKWKWIFLYNGKLAFFQSLLFTKWTRDMLLNNRLFENIFCLLFYSCLTKTYNVEEHSLAEIVW